MGTLDSDFIVLGAGAVGLGVARELLRKHPKSRVTILEKESSVGLHASGRNSGVLHAGFYYSPDSLKAELTRKGNQQLKEFCLQADVPFREIGKLVVTKSEEELPQLDELYSRGIANGVDVEIVDQKQVTELEPLATTVERALWSPRTAVANPMEVTRALAEDVVKRGGQIVYSTAVKAVEPNRTLTDKGEWRSEHVFNCAGMFADRIAQSCGLAQDLTVLPFIGLYLYAPSLKGKYSRLIYPVPDLRNPFLGVHLTVTIDNAVKIGPTAIPVIGREQYRVLKGLPFSDISAWLSNFPRFLFSKNHDVPNLIRSELPKVSASHLERQAIKLVPSIPRGSFKQWGNPGIRAQLFDTKRNSLVMDYLLESNGWSTHVLNAVSPGWTTSLSFATRIVESAVL